MTYRQNKNKKEQKMYTTERQNAKAFAVSKEMRAYSATWSNVVNLLLA